jgi:hypothetical protein
MEIPKNVKAIEFPTSTMWFDENGILCSISKKAPPQSIEESKKGMEEFYKIFGNEKHCMLIDITNASPTNKEARDYAATELPKVVKAIAMISNSALGRMLANLFFGLKPPPYPAKMFSNETKAKEWLKTYL